MTLGQKYQSIIEPWLIFFLYSCSLDSNDLSRGFIYTWKHSFKEILMLQKNVILVELEMRELNTIWKFYMFMVHTQTRSIFVTK